MDHPQRKEIQKGKAMMLIMGRKMGRGSFSRGGGEITYGMRSGFSGEVRRFAGVIVSSPPPLSRRPQATATITDIIRRGEK